MVTTGVRWEGRDKVVLSTISYSSSVSAVAVDAGYDHMPADLSVDGRTPGPLRLIRASHWKRGFLTRNQLSFHEQGPAGGGLLLHVSRSH